MRLYLKEEFKSVRDELRANTGLVRVVLKALDQEVADCPRLFALRPADPRRFDPQRAWASRWRLTLWCEEPGSEHPVHPPYAFKRPKSWFVAVAPYIRMVGKTLSLVAPVAGAVAGLTVGGDSDLKATADLMKSFADATDVVGDSESVRPSGLTRRQGAALRQFREFLSEIDATREFRNLSRTLSPTGQYLWLCNEHHSAYEPDLPRLPYVTGNYEDDYRMAQRSSKE
jgi:internalin A